MPAVRPWRPPSATSPRQRRGSNGVRASSAPDVVVGVRTFRRRRPNSCLARRTGIPDWLSAGDDQTDLLELLDVGVPRLRDRAPGASEQVEVALGRRRRAAKHLLHGAEWPLRPGAGKPAA